MCLYIHIYLYTSQRLGMVVYKTQGFKFTCMVSNHQQNVCDMFISI